MRLQHAETIILEATPSPRVVGVWFFSKAMPLAFLCAGLAFSAWIFINAAPRGVPPPHAASTGVWFVAASFAFAALVAHVYNVFLARTYVYLVTSQRFIFSGGLLRKTTHAVEHRLVTDVQFARNLAEQALALSSVNLSTPGTVNCGPNAKNRSMPELRLEGLMDGETVFEAISTCVRQSHGSSA